MVDTPLILRLSMECGEGRPVPAGRSPLFRSYIGLRSERSCDISLLPLSRERILTPRCIDFRLNPNPRPRLPHLYEHRHVPSTVNP